MKIKDIITESNIEEQKLDEFLPLALAALGGTAAGATLGDYILQKRKGAKDWNLGQSIGRNLERGERFVTQKVAPAAEKLGRDIYKGYTGKDAPETLDQWLDSDDDDPASVKPADSEDEFKARQRRDFEYWPGKQDESVNLKKKHEVVDEKTNDKNKPREKSSFELEVEKNFPDPYIRKAIMAKAQQESGGRNIGEHDWTRTSNDKLYAAFPQLKHLDNTQLNNLKAQGNTVFLDYAYKGIGGYKYRGRGPIQITGKGNYAKLDKQLGLNGELVKDPDMLLRDPALANAASVQYLKNAGLHNKSFDNQRAAHQEVIYAIGGSLYRPGSERGNRVLASIEKGGSVAGSVVSADAVNKAINNTGNNIDKNKVADIDPDKAVPAPTKKRASIFSVPTPVDTGKPGDILAAADKEIADKRAALQRKPMGFVPPPETKSAEPIKVEPDSKEKTASKPLPMASAAAYSDSAAAPADTGSWDKFINTVTKGRVPPEERERVRVPESINKEIADILRLAGKKK